MNVSVKEGTGMCHWVRERVLREETKRDSAIGSPTLIKKPENYIQAPINEYYQAHVM